MFSGRQKAPQQKVFQDERKPKEHAWGASMVPSALILRHHRDTALFWGPRKTNACAVVLRSLRTRGIKDAFDPD